MNTETVLRATIAALFTVLMTLVGYNLKATNDRIDRAAERINLLDNRVTRLETIVMDLIGRQKP